MEIIELEVDAELPDLFLAHIKDNLISIRLLAEKIGVQQSYLNRILTKKYPLTENIRQKMNEQFRTNY